ncbi:MAG: magnesium-translocating P-type ATPase [Acidobacteria bacterium]|nr:magnesium-translocating P-type ATPase [Acidobacteriota bacterium]
MLKPLVDLELKKTNGRTGAGTGPAARQEQGVLANAVRSDSEALLRAYSVDWDGLSEQAVAERLQKYGPNTVAAAETDAWWRHLVHAFNNAFILLLLALAAVAAISGDSQAATIIATMVLVSAILRFAQEFRSSKAAEKLNELVQTTATVTRGGVKVETAVDELVPGDIVHLSAGDMVPADLRLLATKDLFVSQAALTGESMPVEKSAQVDGVPHAELTEQPTLCFMGTNVISGTGTGLVLQTGAGTHLGALAREVTGRRVETDFDRGVSRVSRLLIRFTLVMVPLVFVLNGWTKGDWGQAFFFALSVAVGLTPEMLPMVVTANLARGAVSMSRKKVIVKRLHSIQNFGAMDVLCSDKTGTLTQDRVVLERHLDVLGRASEKVLQLAYLNSYYQTGLKNLLDVAVLQHAELEQGLHLATDYRLVDEIPFDFVRRRISVAVETDKAEELLITKGAVEEMLRITSLVDVDRQLVPLKDELREKALRMARALNEEGFRVIAVGYRKFALGKAVYSVADECELILAGFVAFLDPPKESAAPAIRALKEHGVSVKILTGDNEVVTRKICTEVGIAAGRILLGREIARMDDEALGKVVEETAVFAKVSPLEKARVISALKAQGHVVGFLGDGINDAAALREADIGISVNTAVDVAKESADIILLEKSLMVLEEGVLEGRRTFGNIVKYIRMGTSSNFGNMLSVLGASVWLPFLPMLPVQLLVQNLLYDFSQTAIPFDEVEEEYLKAPRRWDVAAIGRFMLFLGPVSSLFDYATFALMWFYFGAKTPAGQSLFQTGWFVEGLLSQTLIVHIIRTRRIPFLESRAALPLSLLTGLVICAGLAIPFTPFGKTLGLRPLPGVYFGWLVVILSAYGVLTQWMKNWFARRFGYY